MLAGADDLGATPLSIGLAGLFGLDEVALASTYAATKVPTDVGSCGATRREARPSAMVIAVASAYAGREPMRGDVVRPSRFGSSADTEAIAEPSSGARSVLRGRSACPTPQTIRLGCRRDQNRGLGCADKDSCRPRKQSRVV